MASSKIADNSFGQYELEQLVGQDAVRYIYLAYDSEKNRHMLISILRDNLAADENASTNYINRALALSRIRHPNIAIIYDAGVTTNNLPYVVSERIEGFTLADRLSQLAQQKSPAHVIYALSLVRQIASGLALAERLEYFHYELTPQNIILKSMTLKADDSAVLINLDVSTDFDQEERPDEDSDTDSYLSPEQLNNKKIDGRSHVYSLGVILFQLLSGTLPHKTKQNWTHAFQSLRSAGYALERLRTDLAPETYALVDNSMRTRPRSRYRSLGEFVDVIDQAIAAEDLQIHTSGLAEPRRPRPIYLAPLLFLLVCIMLAATTWWISVGNTSSSATIMAGGGSTSPTFASRHSRTSSPSPTVGLITVEETATLGTTKLVAKNPVIDLTVVPSRIPSKFQSIATASATSFLTREVQQTATPTVLVPATAPPTVEAELSTPRPEYRISVSSASLRQGPGTRYGVDGYLLESEEAEIIAKNNSPDIWYLVRTSDGRLGWISSSVGEPIGPTVLENITEAATIPAPPPTPTPSPTATPIPTDTPSPSSNINDDDNNNNDRPEKPKPKSTPTPPL